MESFIGVSSYRDSVVAIAIRQPNDQTGAIKMNTLTVKCLPEDEKYLNVI